VGRAAASVGLFFKIGLFDSCARLEAGAQHSQSPVLATIPAMIEQAYTIMSRFPILILRVGTRVQCGWAYTNYAAANVA
jgi:hypothetical protein